MGGAHTQSKRGEAPAKRAERFIDVLLPESEHPSGTNYSDRQKKLSALQEFRATNDRAVTIFARIDKLLDAEEEELEQRQIVVAEDGRRRRDLDEMLLENDDARTSIQLALEIGERELQSRDTSRMRHLFMFLTAISVLATIGLAYLGALRGEPLYNGGSIIGALLSVGGVFTLRLLIPATGDHRNAATDVAPPHDTS
ncbi:MAG TPA: hypothetical protein VHR18_04095 [Solirubrobacterales bacterium]|jgi:hypothetical protein|nr:hypothetical protein [Solirubrobacterales bacterium]